MILTYASLFLIFVADIVFWGTVFEIVGNNTKAFVASLCFGVVLFFPIGYLFPVIPIIGALANGTLFAIVTVFITIVGPWDRMMGIGFWHVDKPQKNY